jgi:hypothetical protein
MWLLHSQTLTNTHKHSRTAISSLLQSLPPPTWRFRGSKQMIHHTAWSFRTLTKPHPHVGRSNRPSPLTHQSTSYDVRVRGGTLHIDSHARPQLTYRYKTYAYRLLRYSLLQRDVVQCSQNIGTFCQAAVSHVSQTVTRVTNCYYHIHCHHL